MFIFHCRNVLVAVWAVCVFWTRTGCRKTRRTNTLKWSWSILRTMLFVVTLRSTGSANRSWSIVKCAALHRPARARVVLAKATDSHRPSVVRVVLLGEDVIVYICAASVKQFDDDDTFDVALLWGYWIGGTRVIVVYQYSGSFYIKRIAGK